MQLSVKEHGEAMEEVVRFMQRLLLVQDCGRIAGAMGGSCGGAEVYGAARTEPVRVRGQRLQACRKSVGARPNQRHVQGLPKHEEPDLLDSFMDPKLPVVPTV